MIRQNEIQITPQYWLDRDRQYSNMKSWILLLAVIQATTYDSSYARKQPETLDVKDYQDVILKLYQGIGSEDSYDFVRKDFPFTDPKYYMDPKVVEKFIAAYENDFLDKGGYFTLYSYKNRHDTYRLFDLFYYAKDFETFIKIAKWAKSELNPVQFVYSFTAAVYHRKDTKGVIPPPFYEVLPHYFTPSHVMTSAYKAMLQDVKFRKFEVNGTGHEFSWYMDQASDTYKFSQKFNEFDVESRLAYFREDVSFNDWYSKTFLLMAPWISDEKYPDIEWDRRGEGLYIYLRNILGKYNLERYANGLPPVKPLNFKEPIEFGYNSHLLNIEGRPILPRPNGLNPYITNPVGTDYLMNMRQRYLQEIDSLALYNPLNHSFVNIDNVEGFEKFSQIFFGITHPSVRKFYRPLYYQALETLDAAVKASNDIGYSGSAVGNFMTETRDPAFYRILAYLYDVLKAYDSMKTPYTKSDVDFPGVKISSMDFTKLETFMELYEYDISNAIPSKSNTGKYKYLVSRPRLNHKPYSLKMTVESNKDVDGIVSLFIAPKYDPDNRPYGFSGFTKYGVLTDMFFVSLKRGSNTIERKSTSLPYYKETPRIKQIMEKIEQARKSGSSLYFSKDYIDSLPSNLAIPRGSKDGTEFQALAIIYPTVPDTNRDPLDGANVVSFDANRYYLFPFDRPISESVLDTSNVHSAGFTVYDSTK